MGQFHCAGRRQTRVLGINRRSGTPGERDPYFFWAVTPEEVDRVAEVVRRAGGKGPEVCVEYTPHYYAFFFEDPDGNKLEICCRTPATAG